MDPLIVKSISKSNGVLAQDRLKADRRIDFISRSLRRGIASPTRQRYMFMIRFRQGLLKLLLRASSAAAAAAAA